MSRLEGATLAIREAIVEVSDDASTGSAVKRGRRQLADIERDADLIDDLGLTDLEIEGLILIIEDVFGVTVPGDLFRIALFRTPESLADWVVRHAEIASVKGSRS